MGDGRCQAVVARCVRLLLQLLRKGWSVRGAFAGSAGQGCQPRPFWPLLGMLARQLGDAPPGALHAGKLLRRACLDPVQAAQAELHAPHTCTQTLGLTNSAYGMPLECMVRRQRACGAGVLFLGDA